ncbi:MAG: 50S ribosomal protein L11 methyltransferase [Muribaculaceae bacterium]
MSSDYIEVNFEFRPLDADEMDILCALLAEFDYDSFETTDCGVKAYVNADCYDENNINTAVSLYNFHAKIKWTAKKVKQEDWNSEWEKNSFTPIVIGNDCVVHATYHTDYPKCRYDILINPKMSFGSGHHETTSMMIESLLAADVEGCRVVDMGAGTGILSIVAAKLGAASVTGIEIDEMAYENACDNCRLNNVEVNMIHGDAMSVVGMSGCDLFLANINRNIILNDIDKYASCMNNGAKLLVSGFYENDLPVIDERLKSFGFNRVSHKVKNEWTLAEFVLRK